MPVETLNGANFSTSFGTVSAPQWDPSKPRRGGDSNPAVRHDAGNSGTIEEMTQEIVSTSLYERMGGAEAVSRIVESFYVRIEADAHMRPIYPEDLEPGKEKLKLFLQQWLGGPQTYSQRYGHPRLRMRHFPFVIDDLAAGRWLRYMREAWQEEGVSNEIVGIVFERFGPLAHHMVNADQDVPREPLGDVRLQ